MKIAITLIVCFSTLTVLVGNVFAADVLITKPAGELPLSNHSNIDASSNSFEEPIPKKIGSAKSRVIPTSKMAVTETPKQKAQATTGPRVIAKSPTKTVDMRRVAASEKKSALDSSIKPVAEQPIEAATPTSKKAPAKDELPKDDVKVLRVEDILEQSEPFRFSGKDKPDPFIPPLGSIQSKQELKNLSADEIPIVSPLQYFSLRQLVVTGVWQGADNQWKAMIETPDQQGVIVQSGDPIGSSGGHVANIGANGVKVRQYKLQRDGARIYSESVIGMAPEIADKPEAGGKIILKPGVERPEIQKPEEGVELDEEGNPKQDNAASKKRKEKSSAASADVMIEPDKPQAKAAELESAGLPTEMPKVVHEGAEKMLTISPDTAAPDVATPQATPAASAVPTLIPNVLPAGGSL